MPSLFQRRLFHTHFLLPGFMFFLIALILERTTLDIRLMDQLYHWSGGSWNFRDAWITRDLIHDGGRMLVALLVGILLVLLAGSFYIRQLQACRRGLWYLLASLISACLVINLLKELTHIDCPWDLIRYGGKFPYIRNFAAHPESFRTGACFPAGHASAAYAWFGSYYFAREYCPRWKPHALISVLLLGLVFGIGQQLRGAHFLSHDIWTLGLCWFIATLMYFLFFPSSLKTPPSMQPQEKCSVRPPQSQTAP
jgi:membrane-associated PAP2 superfamily phosphatase